MKNLKLLWSWIRASLLRRIVFTFLFVLSLSSLIPMLFGHPFVEGILSGIVIGVMSVVYEIIWYIGEKMR